MKNRILLKRSLLAVLLLTIVLLLFFVIVDTHNYQKNIQIYNNAISKIIDKVKESYPEVDESEIIKTIEEPGIKNDQILVKYGIDTKTTAAIRALDVYHEKERTYYLIFIIGVVLLTSGIFLIYIRSRNRQLEELTGLIKRINDHDYSLDIGLDTEDELSILKAELYKTAIVLKESAENSKKDKLALKDALSDISHQLKTPLTSIMISLDNLDENENVDKEMRREFLMNIKRETANINFLTQAILKLSRLDTNTVTFNKTKVPLKKIIDKSIENVSLIADLKNVPIEVLNSVDKEVECDFTWQVEAVSNVLKNAIEHSDADEPVIFSVSQNKIYTALSIKNRGEKIAKEDIPHIFERFYRGKNASHDSIGIGLALAKSVIKNDGCSIEVESNKKETVFTIKYY